MSHSFTNLLIIELPRAANRTGYKQLGSKVSLLQIPAVVAGPGLIMLHCLESRSDILPKHTRLEINCLVEQKKIY